MFTSGAGMRWIAVVTAFVSAMAAPSSVAVADPGRRIDRAYAVWSVDTKLGPTRYEFEAYRVSRLGRQDVTTGFIATRVCSLGVCIASADLKRVHDAHLEMDPTLSRGAFQMWFAGSRHSADWDASERIPEVATERLGDGDATIERGAEADGNVLGASLPTDGVQAAGVERGTGTGDLDPPPSPWSPTLPGFGAPAFAASSTCWTPRVKEQGFARAMNKERRARNLGRMRLDPELSKAARVHTRRMIGRDLLHHTSAATLRRRVTNWLVLGENVGVGVTVGSLHAAFMASPAHKDNILYRNFKHVGVGTATGLGRLWVTVIFEAKDDPGTRLRMPHC